mgnify:CR=1 FL=1
MELITKRQLIDSVAERWKVQYYSGPRQGWAFTTSGASDEIYRRLKALPQNATEDQAAAIIGNSGWTRIECDECGKYVDAAVQLGEPPDYESATAVVCLDCLKAAAALLEGA